MPCPNRRNATNALRADSKLLPVWMPAETAHGALCVIMVIGDRPLTLTETSLLMNMARTSTNHCISPLTLL
eukprot:284894-Rhodomonas_salina.1